MPTGRILFKCRRSYTEVTCRVACAASGRDVERCRRYRISITVTNLSPARLEFEESRFPCRCGCVDGYCPPHSVRWVAVFGGGTILLSHCIDESYDTPGPPQLVCEQWLRVVRDERCGGCVNSRRTRGALLLVRACLEVPLTVSFVGLRGDPVTLGMCDYHVTTMCDYYDRHHRHLLPLASPKGVWLTWRCYTIAAVRLVRK